MIIRTRGMPMLRPRMSGRLEEGAEKERTSQGLAGFFLFEDRCYMVNVYI